jgi:Rod binding domain-containing protein
MIDAPPIPTHARAVAPDLLQMQRGHTIAPSVVRDAREEGSSEFSTFLAGRRIADAETKSREQEAEEAARQLVATTFIQPLLEQLNEPTFLSDGPFMPGDAERRFSPLLHQHLADRIAEAGNFPLTSAVKRSLLAKSHDASRAAAGTVNDGGVLDVTR